MKAKEGEDPDAEGFIPCELQINSFNNAQEQKQPSLNCIFEPHYILGTSMLKKEPPEFYRQVDHIPVVSKQNNNGVSVVKVSGGKVSLAELNTKTDKFKNVYSRLKNPLGSGPREIFQHQITLKTSNYQHYHFTRYLRPWKQQNQRFKDHNDLVFDSKFQGGNLLSAYRILDEENTYLLFMQNDTNTYGYNQWFNFSIKNALPKTKYTIRIANFRKKYSFFKKGMKPVIFSMKKHKKQGNGWYRDGYNMSYYESQFEQPQNSPYYTLQFNIDFEYANDYITISANPPYSYSRLIFFIENLSKSIENKEIKMETRSLGRSLGGNNVPYIKLYKNAANLQQKPHMIILGRQHPGQIWSSFVLQNFLSDLTNSDKEQSVFLLQNYNFHIFPMLNVDGVIYGNFRCDIAGYDINRCWKDTSHIIHPQIYRILEVVQKLAESNQVQFCIDLHTHSKQLGIFSYCCVESPECKILPLFLSQMTNLYRIKACTFGIAKDKRQTARAALFEIGQCRNVMTIELSTFGYLNQQSRQYEHFSMKDLKIFASAIVNSLYKNLKKDDLGFSNGIAEDSQLINSFLNDSLDEAVEGSDSEPDADEIQSSQKMKKIFPKSFAKQVKKKSNLKKKVQTPSIKKPNKSKAETQPSENTEHKTQIKIKSRYEQSFSQKRRKGSASPTNSYLFNETIQKKTLDQSQKIYKKLRPTPELSVSSKPALKTQKAADLKVQLDVEWKPLSTLQFSIKNLPCFPKQVIKQPYQVLGSQNHSIMMTTMGLPRRQRRQKIVRFEKIVQKKQQFQNTLKGKTMGLQKPKEEEEKDLPYLCILSDKRRVEHIKNIKQRKTDKQYKINTKVFKTQMSQKVNTNLNKEEPILANFYKNRKLYSKHEAIKIVQNLNKYKIKSTHF